MALNETDRKKVLEELGLATEGETLAPDPAAPSKASKKKAPKKAKEPEPEVQTDVETLTTEQLLTPGAFDLYKLEASKVGRAVSSPHNKRLYARIQEAVNAQRTAHQQAKQQAKQERKKEDRNHVREKVKADTANRAAQAVLEAMTAAGINLDELADLAEALKERNT